MKSLEDQISNRCIHFNGIMNKCCKVGINYDDVKVDKPFKFPCLKQGGECSHSQFPSPEQVQERIKEISELGERASIAYAAIKAYYNRHKQQHGKIQCDCGGELSYTVAKDNGHIWAKCSKCDISFAE